MHEAPASKNAMKSKRQHQQRNPGVKGRFERLSLAFRWMTDHAWRKRRRRAKATLLRRFPFFLLFSFFPFLLFSVARRHKSREIGVGERRSSNRLYR